MKVQVIDVRISGRTAYLTLDDETFLKLDKLTRFHPPGYKYTPEYRLWVACQEDPDVEEGAGWDGYRHFLTPTGRLPLQLFRTRRVELERKAEIKFNITDEDVKPVFFKALGDSSDRKYQNDCVNKMLLASAHGGGLILNATGCLVGSTYIDCPRDLEKYPHGIPIKELIGKKPWVYSFDMEAQRVVLARASSVSRTGKRKPVYKVTFKIKGHRSRNGGRKIEFLDHVIGTADHPFLLRKSKRIRSTNSGHSYEGHEYRQLLDLQHGDRVMPLFRTFEEGYASLNLNNGSQELEHRFILGERFGRRSPAEAHGHHNNEQHLDNSVSNLEWKKPSKHHADHATKRNLERTFGWQARGEHPKGMLGKHQTDNQRKAVTAWADKEWERKSKTEKWRRKEVLTTFYCKLGWSCSDISAKFEVSVSKVIHALKRNGLYAPNNHIVEKVEFYGYEDVYDMTVPEHHNFVANGVFVHNTGKTYIGALYFSFLEGNAVFIVDEKALMRQAQKELADGLGEEVGIIGDSTFAPKRITVATVQSLYKHHEKPHFRKWRRDIDVTFVDELHKALNHRHFAVVRSIPAGAVFGLTATLSAAKRHIRMQAHALCGGVVFAYPLVQGVKEGFLTKGRVIQVEHRQYSPKQKSLIGYNMDYEELIVDSDSRNRLIYQLVKKCLKEDRYVAVLVERVKHLKILSEMFHKIPHQVVFGKVKGTDRLQVVKNFERDEFRLILANVVFTKGIDIKRLDGIINGAAKKSPDDALQAYGRGVRLHKDKRLLLYYDIRDTGNRFEEAAEDRKKAFEKAGIEVRVRKDENYTPEPKQQGSLFSNLVLEMQKRKTA